MKSSEDQARAEALVRETLERVADKWTLLVIDALAEGETRFSRLRERIGGISQKMLTQTLRQLERDGLVTRRRWCLPAWITNSHHWARAWEKRFAVSGSGLKSTSK